MSDGALAGPGFEEARWEAKFIHGELEGRQLAWLYLPGPVQQQWLVRAWREWGKDPRSLPREVAVGGPPEWAGIAMEFTDAGKMLIWAAPNHPLDAAPRTTTVLWRWFEPPQVLWGTRERAAHLRGFTREPLVDEIQHVVHGLLCKGVVVKPEANPAGGQDVDFLFSEGVTLHLASNRAGYRRGRIVAGYVSEVTLEVTRPAVFISTGPGDAPLVIP